MDTFTCNTQTKEVESSSLETLVESVLKCGGKCSESVSVLVSVPRASRSHHAATDQAQISAVKEQSTLPTKSLKDLLKKGSCDVNEAESDSGLSMLMYLCSSGRTDAVKLLLGKRASPTLVDADGWSSLHYAVWGQNIGCIKALLSGAGASIVNAQDKRGITPLMVAVYRCGQNVVQLLMKKGANVFATDACQRSALHWAVISKQVVIVKYLLNKFFKTKDQRGCVDAGGASPLHYACAMGSCEVVTLFLTEGFDLSVQTGSATQSDCKEGHDDLLLSSLADGLTPVHWACALSHKQVLIILLQEQQQQEGMVGALSKQRLTPLHMAACVGSKELCGILIDNGAVVNAKSTTGITPLHLACHFGHLDCVSLLLDRKADVDALNSSNMSGLHMACREGFENVGEYLVVKGASRDLPFGPEGNSPLHISATFGRNRVIEMLLRQGCSADLARESDGRPSLHLSAANGHLECCKVLVENGKATVNYTDSTIERCGALDLALLNNHRECSEYLITQGAYTQGGMVHRAACTIQLSWRLHVHKRRRKVTMNWAAQVIQYFMKKWLRRVWARRTRQVRERRRQDAAITLQRGWKSYIEKKRELEESYNALRTKLTYEHIATNLIISELNLQQASIQLPRPALCSAVGETHISRVTPHSSVPTTTNPKCTASFLRSAIEPAPFLPNERLLFEQKPRTPLMKLSRHNKVRTNTVPTSVKDASKDNDGRRNKILTAPTKTGNQGDKHVSLIQKVSNISASDLSRERHSISDGACNKTEQNLMKLSTTLISSDVNREVTGHGTSSHSNLTLPPLESKQSCFVSKQTSDDTGSKTREEKRRVSLPPLVTSPSSHPLKVVSPRLGQRSSQKINASGGDHVKSSNNQESTDSVERRGSKRSIGSKNQPSERRKKTTNDKKGFEGTKTLPEKPHKKGEESTSIDSSKLLLNAQRFQKLQHVAVLLDQARSIHSISGNDSGYDELKTQIQAALEEAIRLRADTESICDKSLSA